jgi:uncharacterized protein (TIGR03067 family)
MKTLAALTLVLSSSLLASAGDAGKKALAGTWQIVRYERGDKAKKEGLDKVRVTFAEGEIVFSVEGEKKEAAKYTLDATKKPHEIDIAPPREQKVVKGIYKLEGDTLTIVTSKEGDERPASFEAKGGNTTLMVLKREKK